MKVILIGYRGSGKTAVGELLGKDLGWKTISTDSEIVRRAGVSIPEIVESGGWDHFRDLESEVLRGLEQEDRIVVDCGGGAILRPENVESLKVNGTVFWLIAGAASIRERIQGDDQRPSLTGTGSFLEEVSEVLKEREPKYREAADHAVETDGRTVEEVAGEILRILGAVAGEESGPRAPVEREQLFASEDQKTSLSRLMCFMLRHQPGEFGLTLDGQGYAGLETVVRAIQTVRGWVTREHVLEVVGSCPRGRFETDGSRLRASYGHSVAISDPGPQCEPPELLYHGASPSELDGIADKGLQPRGRRFVHLSVTKEEAHSVASRRSAEPVVLRIRAGEAHQEGIRFARGGKLYLVESVPPCYIDMGPGIPVGGKRDADPAPPIP